MSDDKTLQLLRDFIAIESVSADPKRKNHISKAVAFIQVYLENLGFTVRIIEHKEHPPLILAELINDVAPHTIGVYAHYDVQPEDPINEWHSKPFELTEKDGRFFARGVADDKGHLIQILSALDELVNEKTLSNSIVCIFEGEEETGSQHLEHYIKQTLQELEKVDVFYIFDMGMYQKNIPQIYYALRGLVYFELDIITGTHDIHSGSYGNKVLNPAIVASQLFSHMKDSESQKVLIPGFYDDVLEPSTEEREQLLSIARPDEEELVETGVFKLVSVGDEHSFLSTKILPSLDINGFESGYLGPGAKTIIPYKATVKFSCRLVEKQNPDKIIKIVSEFIAKNLPVGVKHDVRILSSDSAFYTATNNEFVKLTADILEQEFGSKVIFNRSGGSISAAEVLQRLIKKPVILTGFILPDCNLHAPNENYDEDMFWKGIQVLKRILSV